MESKIGGGKVSTEIFNRDYYWINNENDEFSLGSFDFFNKYVFVDDLKGGGFFDWLFGTSNSTSKSTESTDSSSESTNSSSESTNSVSQSSAVVEETKAEPVSNIKTDSKAKEGTTNPSAEKVNTSGKKTNKTIFNYGTESQNKAWKNLIIDLLAMSFHTSGNKSGYFGDIKLTEPKGLMLDPKKGEIGHPYNLGVYVYDEKKKKEEEIKRISYFHYEWLDPPSRLIKKKSNEKDILILNELQKGIHDIANTSNEADGESNFKGLTKIILRKMIDLYRMSVIVKIDYEAGAKFDDLFGNTPGKYIPTVVDWNNVESKTINMTYVKYRRKLCDDDSKERDIRDYYKNCDSTIPDALILREAHSEEPRNMGIINDLGERMQKTLPGSARLKYSEKKTEKLKLDLQEKFFPSSINDEYFENMPEEVIENTNIFLSLLEIEFILRTERVNANDLAYEFEKDKYKVLSEEQIDRNKKYGYKNEANIDDFFNNAAKKLFKRIKRDYYKLSNKNVDLEQTLLSKWDGKNYYDKSSKDISFKNIYADNEDDINKFKNALQEGKGSIICLQIEKIQKYLKELQESKIMKITFKEDKMEDKTLFVRKICESLIEKANKIIKKFDEKDPSIKKLENLKTECNIKFGKNQKEEPSGNKGGKKRVTRRKSLKKKQRKTKRKSRK